MLLLKPPYAYIYAQLPLILFFHPRHELLVLQLLVRAVHQEEVFDRCNYGGIVRLGKWGGMRGC